MPGQEIDAVFENGVFRPLQAVGLPEHQRVTLVLPQPAADDVAPEQDDTEVAYKPLPLGNYKTIRVRVKHIGELGPIPYPIEPDDAEET